MTTLILGCSYTNPDQSIWHNIVFDDYTIIARPGVDNEWIARSGMHALENQNFDEVFVMFTGLDRVSVPMSADQKSDYYFDFPVADRTEYESSLRLIQSGGMFGSWSHSSELDKSIHNVFKQYYFSVTTAKKYRAQQSLYHCIMFINYLIAKNIKYKYTFIYDPLNKNNDCAGLGYCDDNVYWNALPKTHFVDFFPFDFAVKNNLFGEDGRHLSYVGQKAWASQFKNLL